MSQVIPVILCGGSGTRLWPLSRTNFPKQFLSLLGNGQGASLFQEAIKRIGMIDLTEDSFGQTLVITGEDHRFLALDQMQFLGRVDATLILEPTGRNTAPAMTLAALCSNGNKEDPILVVTPADQTVKNNQAFAKALYNCIQIIKQDKESSSIAILGVTPTGPETGYGYIKCGGDFDSNSGCLVESFVEKPDLKTAQQYLAGTGYFWNSGIFVMRASTWLNALRVFRPDILHASERAWQAQKQDMAETARFIRPGRAEFMSIPSESIDYAVIENCPGSNQFNVKMVELNAGWSDLGAWSAVWQEEQKDEKGNVAIGDVLLCDTKNSLIHASSRLVGMAGVENLIVIETPDAVLVADLNNSQNVKKIVSKLDEQKREEKNLHRKVARPWGWYDSVDEGKGFKVKRIQVKPGASLSLQMHHHRAEHWIVVQGVAEIVNGNQVITLNANQSTYIPLGQVHRLSNPGNTPLEIIEVQSGDYLGEDDIVRFDDVYGRMS